MEIRADPDQGGDGTTHGIAVVDDTGSDVMCIFDTDVARLGNLGRTKAGSEWRIFWMLQAGMNFYGRSVYSFASWTSSWCHGRIGSTRMR